MEKFVIDLGKGLELSAPIKKRMTVHEWHRMVTYISNILEGLEHNQEPSSNKIKTTFRGK
jgi:hypothetical protein